MNFVTWNCNGGLRNKLKEAESLDADILIIQECEDPERSTQAYRDWAGEYLWVGKNKNKGIGIFPKNGNEVTLLNWSGSYSIPGLISSSASTTWSTAELQLFLPFRINNHYNVLACWTKGSDSQAFGYIGQLWKYLQIHRTELSAPNTIIAGDLNSNKVWDKPDRWWNHTDTFNEIANIGLQSLYHYQSREIAGKETQPTFFLHRKQHKPYHIDYVLLPQNLLDEAKLSIGEYNKWITVSDHLPLIFEIGS
ncbi:endonuclease/exonuclease/phosphatase family protein [Microbulbifer salipaludis]|uniref:Endonuclease/exonuclease/phosphatase family protein n=1 Tax=Microbulbifer salipaludis TaxID=187980 RepID=A0ABS3E548_9GAMM|nr:endonuclease/exonuclease/phosphatase family protein [Microbulbifer salipaludis]MBN8430420.1 endonuclease/exonuclease/phosphatase family protein [Microbulbifer salipaludis]